MTSQGLMAAPSSEIILLLFLRVETKDGSVDNFACLWMPEPAVGSNYPPPTPVLSPNTVWMFGYSAYMTVCL